MKERDKRKSAISSKLRMIYTSSNNDRQPNLLLRSSFYFTTLHFTSVHLSTLHFLSFVLHATTLHYLLI